MTQRKKKIKLDVNNYLEKMKELAYSKHVGKGLQNNSEEFEKIISKSSKLLVLHQITYFKYF